MDLASLDTTLNQMRSAQSIQRGLQARQVEGDDYSSTPTGQSLTSFGNLLSTEIDKINQLDATARQNVETYATGGNVPLHQVVLSVEKADMALQMATQVRNRLVGAYQEISRMQV